MEDEKIYSHIFYPDTQDANRVPWGRGNGWIFNSLSDVISLMPDDVEGKERLVQMFIEFAYALKDLQDSDGLWHQVLNRSDSYQETSCSAMFMLGLCRGVNMGILSRDDFEETIQKAYEGITRLKIDSVGNVYDVCQGSSCCREPEYYMKLGTILNDDHGTGIILSAFTEYSKMLGCVKK